MASAKQTPVDPSAPSAKQFMREIARDARDERIKAFLHKYRVLLALAGAAAIIAIAGTAYYLDVREQKRALSASNFVDAFFIAQQSTTPAADNPALQALRQQTIADEVPGFSMVAEFQQAHDLAAIGRASEAGLIYAQLANDQNIPEHYRESCCPL